MDVVNKKENKASCKHWGTSMFLAKQVTSALKPWSELLPTLFAFHVGVGWGNARRTLAPVLASVNDSVRPPLVWLFGPLPKSSIARSAIQDLIYYFFDLQYAVRWTSSCGACCAGVPHHESVFSILACLHDVSQHCTTEIRAVPRVSFAEYNAGLGLTCPMDNKTAVTVRATRMEAASLSILHLRSLFSSLLFGEAATPDVSLPAWNHFFRLQCFISMERNVPTLFLNSDGYGFEGEFGIVRVLPYCVRGDTTCKKRAGRSKAQVEWDCSFHFERRVRAKKAGGD